MERFGESCESVKLSVGLESFRSTDFDLNRSQRFWGLGLPAIGQLLPWADGARQQGHFRQGNDWSMAQRFFARAAFPLHRLRADDAFGSQRRADVLQCGWSLCKCTLERRPAGRPAPPQADNMRQSRARGQCRTF